ncbi:MAG TPA: AAA family ATPase [Elusimicrobiales bacterium]|nr:AAA family ATPase [Elusimicrobiales bacterium]
MELSQDQHNALAELLGWYKDAGKKQFITLGGYAGTGKTTLIAVFKSGLAASGAKIRIAFCSYTGRAAQNLKNKLKEAGALSAKDSVSTIHGLIYTPLEDGDGRISGWDRKEELERDLIIVDEASMVDGAIWRDLLSYNIPVIAVGDHGQLPPIAGNFNLMEAPEILLTRIHRQAKDNPIIKVSEYARTTGLVPVKKYGPGVAKYSREDSEAQEKTGELLESYSPDTLILCGYNSTRTKINQFIRGSLGFETPEPARGDRVICLRNNRKKAVFNGMLGTIQHIAAAQKDWYSAEIKMDDREKLYSGLIYAPQFGAKSGVNYTKDRRLAAQGDLFDFGYALTVHKAQGSQARKVIMFEERFAQMDDEMWRRWLYTGVTRAEEELYLFGQ